MFYSLTQSHLFKAFVVSFHAGVFYHTSSQTVGGILCHLRCKHLSFVSRHANLPLSPWHGVFFFERLVERTKELLRKDLETYRLTYDELQTILYETEAILNNRTITYYYENESEFCLTSSHLLYGRALQLYNSAVLPLAYPNSSLSLESHFDAFLE